MKDPQLLNAAFTGFCTVLILLIAGFIIYRAAPPAEGRAKAPAEPSPDSTDLETSHARLLRENAELRSMYEESYAVSQKLRTECSHQAAEIRRLRHLLKESETHAVQREQRLQELHALNAALRDHVAEIVREEQAFWRETGNEHLREKHESNMDGLTMAVARAKRFISPSVPSVKSVSATAPVAASA